MQAVSYLVLRPAKSREKLSPAGLLPIVQIVNPKYQIKPAVRCHYVNNCYLAEALECYGYKTDCPLYMRSNGEPCNDARFHAAMDRLIFATKEKHERRDKSRPK